MQSVLGWLNDFGIGAIVAVLAACLVLAVALFIGWRRYNTADERERRRRVHVNSRGRITVGTLLDLQEADEHYLFHYTYSVGGAEYSASQDMAAILDQIPTPHESLIGSVAVKYDPNNAPNSIILCEAWSGLRSPAGDGAKAGEPQGLATQSRRA